MQHPISLFVSDHFFLQGVSSRYLAERGVFSIFFWSAAAAAAACVVVGVAVSSCRSLLRSQQQQQQAGRERGVVGTLRYISSLVFIECDIIG